MPANLRTLTPEEVVKLERVANSRSEEARMVERATLILRAFEGWPVARIAQDMGVSENTVRLWVCRFNELGLEGLKDRTRGGRPGVYSPEQIAEVIAAATTPPAELGLDFNHWTLDRLEGYINDDRGIPIKRSRIGEVLLKSRLRLKDGVWKRVGTQPLE